MVKERLPQNILNWIPTGRRKRGRPKTRWKEGIFRVMEEGLQDGDWVSKDIAICHGTTTHIHIYKKNALEPMC
jgi:hypothetical protein